MKTITRFTTAALIVLSAAVPLAADIVVSVEVPTKDDGGRERAARESRHEEALYDAAVSSLDEHEWRRAVTLFQRVAALRMEHADAAFYWLAYAQNKAGMRSEALSTLMEFRKTYPKSRWAEDGKALEVEIRQSAGQAVAPEHVDDEDVKLMALIPLMQSEPQRAIPQIETILSGQTARKTKERALFVLTQCDSPQAYAIVMKVAKGQEHPELQNPAVRYLGAMGNEESRKVLTEVYAQTQDVKVKRTVLRSYVIAGDRVRLANLAKEEQNPELRADAVMQLGMLGARTELGNLYAAEPNTEIRKRIIQAMFIGGSAERLAAIAKTEKVPELRVAAIRNIGLLGSSSTLVSIYEREANVDVRRAIVRALAGQQNAKALEQLAEKEKDASLKREIAAQIDQLR